MPDPQTRESRPTQKDRTASQNCEGDASSVPNREPVRIPATLTDRQVTEAVEGVLAAVVVTCDAEGRVRRRTMLTLAAAERAARRAGDAGRPAVVSLVRLQLVATTTGRDA